MRLDQPHIARVPQATPAPTLRVGAFNARPWSILLVERFCRLPFSGVLECLIRLTRLESDEARLLLGPRTLCPVWTRRTVLAGKAHLPHHAILGLGVREPGEALLPQRAGDHLLVPVDQKLRFVKSGARPGLPAWVVGHRANERDPIRALALDQHLRVGIALVHSVLCGQPAFQRLSR